MLQEVLSYIEELNLGDVLDRVSFVAHSMGGLVVRASLSKLYGRLGSKFFTFISLSSPHLGYLYQKSKLIDAGFWVLKKLKKSVCLQQLSLDENQDLHETILYKLSLEPFLGRFKNVVLVSCYQDLYVPYESSRIEKVNLKVSSPSHNVLMANILSNITASKLTRLDVNFKISEKSIDSFIGRTAHIHFIASQELAQLLAFSYPTWFA